MSLPSAERQPLRMPLLRCGQVSAPHPKKSPTVDYELTPSGVVTASDGELSYHEPGLSKRLWWIEGFDRASLIVSDGTLYFGPTRQYGGAPTLLAVNIDSGRIEKQVGARIAETIGCSVETVLLRLSDKGDFSLIAVDRKTLEQRWHGAGHYGVLSAVSDGQRYIVALPDGKGLQCLDARTGAALWEFLPPPAERRTETAGPAMALGSLHSSVRMTGERTVAVTLDRRIFSIASDTGRVLQVGRVARGGLVVLTDVHVYVVEPARLSAFDHEQMRDVGSVEYPTEAATLYGARDQRLAGAVVTDECVVWTATHGALMGINRSAGPTGSRRTWTDAIPEAVMPIGRSPREQHGFLYFAPRFASFNDSPGLLCYRTASSLG